MREIWQFLLVLLAGAIFACALVFWMVRGDALDKRMYLYQVLLSPETIENLSNRAVAGGKDRPPEYLIESIRFSYLDETTKKWVEKQINIGPYGQFYSKIEHDRGVIDPSESVLQSFQASNATKLSIYMKHYHPLVNEGKTELFQMVQFNQEGDAYRVNLHVESNEMQWVYFLHPGVGKVAEGELIE